MFNDRSTATSSSSVAKFSSVTMAPSIARMKVFSPELWNVLQDAPQVGWFHLDWLMVFRRGISNQFCARFNNYFKAVFKAASPRSFSLGVPTEMRIHSGN